MLAKPREGNRQQLDTIVDALQHVTDYDYDNYGHLIKTTSAKGTLDQTVERYEYDLAGNLTASIDANTVRLGLMPCYEWQKCVFGYWNYFLGVSAFLQETSLLFSLQLLDYFD